MADTHLLLKTHENQPLWQDSDGTLHEIYTANIFVGTQYLGAFQYDSGRADLRWKRTSTAFFCPSCGEVWGRLVATDSSGHQQPFEVYDVACTEHISGYYDCISGSLLVWNLANLLKDFPADAVKYEFTVHLNYFLRKMK